MRRHRCPPPLAAALAVALAGSACGGAPDRGRGGGPAGAGDRDARAGDGAAGPRDAGSAPEDAGAEPADGGASPADGGAGPGDGGAPPLRALETFTGVETFVWGFDDRDARPVPSRAARFETTRAGAVVEVTWTDFFGSWSDPTEGELLIDGASCADPGPMRFQVLSYDGRRSGDRGSVETFVLWCRSTTEGPIRQGRHRVAARVERAVVDNQDALQVGHPDFTGVMAIRELEAPELAAFPEVEDFAWSFEERDARPVPSRAARFETTRAGAVVEVTWTDFFGSWSDPTKGELLIDGASCADPGPMVFQVLSYDGRRSDDRGSVETFVLRCRATADGPIARGRHRIAARVERAVVDNQDALQLGHPDFTGVMAIRELGAPELAVFPEVESFAWSFDARDARPAPSRAARFETTRAGAVVEVTWTDFFGSWSDPTKGELLIDGASCADPGPMRFQVLSYDGRRSDDRGSVETSVQWCRATAAGPIPGGVARLGARVERAVVDNQDALRLGREDLIGVMRVREVEAPPE